MRVALLMVLAASTGSSHDELGMWKLNPRRSAIERVDSPKALTLRIEHHPKGEVITLDRIGWDGRANSDSAILYLDGKPRLFLDDGCMGTQSSQRLDDRMVEIRLTCENGGWVRVIRRVTEAELILQASGRRSDGRQFETRMVFERQ